VQVPCDEGVAIHIGPRVMRSGPRGPRRSVDRGVHRPAIEPRKGPSRVPTPCNWRKATRQGALTRALRRPGVVRDPGMCRRFLRGNREISRSTVRQLPPVRIGKARSRSR